MRFENVSQKSEKLGTKKVEKFELQKMTTKLKNLLFHFQIFGEMFRFLVSKMKIVFVFDVL